MKKWVALCFIAAVLAIPSAVFAQGSGSSLSGLITDNSQAVVPQATVKVRQLATNVTTETISDAAGYYRFPSLPVGEYEITIDHPGFAQISQHVRIETARETRQDFALAVAGGAQTVTVSANVASYLSPDDAMIGTTFDTITVEQTPLYLRNWDDLLRLAPGVEMSPYTAQSGATSAGRTGDFNVHGIHSLENNFILDGIDNNSMSENVQELSDSTSRPSVDTIQEFRIITNPYSAEYGRAPGAAVSVVTKGGTNAIHGLLFEYLRNRDLDANDFFSNQNGLAKPENVQNQFGGNLGGPIIKNKLFWFFDYEGTRIQTAVNRITTVPLANERIGDFSPAESAALGIPYPTIYDPLTGAPFPNNTIPASRIDPYMTKIMNLFPLPNLPGEYNNYTRNAISYDNDDNYDGRADWNATDKDLVFFRYSYSNRDRFIPGYFGGIADGTPTSAWGRQKLLSHSGVLGFTHIFTPTLTNEFRFGYERNYSYAQQDPFGLNQVDQYVPGVPQNPAVAGGISQTYFDTEGALIGSPDFLPKFQTPQQFQLIDSVSLLAGTHSFKFGGDIHWTRNIFMDEPGTRGSLYFDNIFTCQIVDGECANNTGNSYADGLLGYVQAAQLTNVFDVDQRLRMFGLYAQDDWKVTRKLTVNLGLRWDFAPYPLEGKNQLANFNPAGSGSLIQATGGSLASRSLINPDWHDWGPRVGIAYSLDPKTVIRAGYGIFYTLFERVGSEDELALNPPGLVNNTPAVGPGATAPGVLPPRRISSQFSKPGGFGSPDHPSPGRESEYAQCDEPAMELRHPAGDPRQLSRRAQLRGDSLDSSARALRSEHAGERCPAVPELRLHRIRQRHRQRTLQRIGSVTNAAVQQGSAVAPGLYLVAQHRRCSRRTSRKRRVRAKRLRSPVDRPQRLRYPAARGAQLYLRASRRTRPSSVLPWFGCPSPRQLENFRRLHILERPAVHGVVRKRPNYRSGPQWR